MKKFINYASSIKEVEYSVYGILLKGFALFGVDVRKNPKATKFKKVIQKEKSFFILMLLLVSFIYTLLVILTEFVFNRTSFQFCFVNFIGCLLSLSQWIEMYRKRSRINAIRKKAYFSPFRLNIRTYNKSNSINSCVAVLLFSLPAFSVISALVDAYAGVKTTIFTLGNIIESPEINTITHAICYIAFHLPMLVLPTFIHILLCVMYDLCSNLLRQYHAALEECKKSNRRQRLSDLVHSYTNIVWVVEGINKGLSTPSLISSIIFFLKMVSGVAWVTSYKGQWRPHTVNALYTFVTSVLCTVSLHFSAWDVPVTMREIRSFFQRVEEDELRCPDADGHLLEMARSVAKKEDVEMSAGHVIQLSKSSMVSMFGVLFTYGLLFVNVK